MSPPRIKLVLACLITLVSSALSHAAPSSQPLEQERDLAPIHWPQTPRPIFGKTEYHATFDGIHVPMVSIQSGNLSLELSNRKSLSIRNPSSARYSSELSDTRIPGVSMGISLFSAGEFLPDLSEESWTAYKTGLFKSRPEIALVFENSNIETNTTPYIFGQQFRQLAYEQETSRGTVKRREIFAFVKGSLLVFTISGPKEFVDQNWNSAEHLISEMELI